MQKKIDQNQRVVIALFACLVLWCGWQSRLSSQHQKQYENNNPSTKPNPETPKVSTDERIANYTLSLAILTGVLAASTIGLWIVNYFVLRHGRETAERQLRAYVMIDAASIENVKIGGCPEAKLTIKNYGQTPAINLTHWARMGFYPYPLPLTSVPLPKKDQILPPRPLGPGAVVHVFSGIDKPLNPATLNAIEAKKYAIYVTGEIRYEDAFGKLRETDFLVFCHGSMAARGAMASYDTGNRIT